jgi:hypothetical protein
MPEFRTKVSSLLPSYTILWKMVNYLCHGGAGRLHISDLTQFILTETNLKEDIFISCYAHFKREYSHLCFTDDQTMLNESFRSTGNV